MDDVAVIMAQTACEIALQDLISTLLRRLAMPSPMQSWIEDVIDGSSTLRNSRLYELYKALSGDRFKDRPLWPPYDRHVGLRNEIVHRGGHASKAQAIEACDTAQKVIQHFETLL
jgi:hypothetical protein